jgi:hypothetical protein
MLQRKWYSGKKNEFDKVSPVFIFVHQRISMGREARGQSLGTDKDLDTVPLTQKLPVR